MAEITLTANIRTDLGRSAANTLRRAGRVPGVYYLHNEKNIAFDVKLLDLRPLVYTADTHIVNLQLSDGTAQKCVIREVQFDPLTDKVAHIDLMGLLLTDTISVEVPVTLHGQPQGVRDGGVMNHIIHKVEIECVASELPEHIEIDVSEMLIGMTVTIADLNIGTATIHADPEQPVVSITHARGAEAVAPGTEAPATVAEPEIIGKGKTDDEK